MNSIAVWYEEVPGNNAESVSTLDIHINHWKLKIGMNSLKRIARSVSTKTVGKFISVLSYNDSEYFIDVGLMVKDGASVGNICIYLPSTSVDKRSILDLGNKLKNLRTLTAIFNEPLTVKLTNGKHFEVYKNNIHDFNVFELSVLNDVQLSAEFQGTIIRFQHRQIGDVPTYYRFRLKGGFVKNLSLTYTPSNFLFESAYSKIEVIDFRINDTRNLDVSLMEHILDNQRFNLALVHYFVMRNLRDEYIISNKDINGVRQLERGTWLSYIDEDEYVYEGSFAYHLKSKADISSKKFIDDFTAVFKFQYEDSKIIRYIVGFLIVALLIELMGNRSYDYLSELFSTKSKYLNNCNCSKCPEHLTIDIKPCIIFPNGKMPIDTLTSKKFY